MDPQRQEHLAQNLLAADHVGSDKYEQLGQEQPPYRDQRAPFTATERTKTLKTVRARRPRELTTVAPSEPQAAASFDQ